MHTTFRPTCRAIAIGTAKLAQRREPDIPNVREEPQPARASIRISLACPPQVIQNPSSLRLLLSEGILSFSCTVALIGDPLHQRAHWRVKKSAQPIEHVSRGVVPVLIGDF